MTSATQNSTDEKEACCAPTCCAELWAGCVAGALQEEEYREKLSAVLMVPL